MSAAVVLMAYGSPERLEDVPAYYADIRGGRPISPENLDDLVDRYRRLGIEEANPLNAITEETRAALEAALGLPVFTGMKHWHAADRRGRRPRCRRRRRHGRRARPRAALLAPLDRGLPRPARRRARRPRRSSPSSRAGTTTRASSRSSPTASAAPRAHVVFTAHSLPARILDDGDPYRDQLLETSRLVADAAGVDDWSFSFQSESPTGEPWLGPDILDHLADLRTRGVEHVLVCPVGFVSDHLEIRWDIDTEAQEKAAELGMRLERIEMPNADPRVRRRARGDRPARARARRGMTRRVPLPRTRGDGVKPGEIVVDRVSRRFRVSRERAPDAEGRVRLARPAGR